MASRYRNEADPPYALTSSTYSKIVVNTDVLMLVIYYGVALLLLYFKYQFPSTRKIYVMEHGTLEEQKSHPYLVSITTGNRQGASYVGSVRLTIFGTQSNPAVLTINTESNEGTNTKFLQRYKTNSFLIYSPESLGDIRRLYLDLMPAQRSAQTWFLESIEILNTRTRDKWVFWHNAWLNAFKSVGHTELTEMTRFTKKSFGDNFSHCCKLYHSWLAPLQCEHTDSALSQQIDWALFATIPFSAMVGMAYIHGVVITSATSSFAIFAHFIGCFLCVSLCNTFIQLMLRWSRTFSEHRQFGSLQDRDKNAELGRDDERAHLLTKSRDDHRNILLDADTNFPRDRTVRAHTNVPYQEDGTFLHLPAKHELSPSPQESFSSGKRMDDNKGMLDESLVRALFPDDSGPIPTPHSGRLSEEHSLLGRMTSHAHTPGTPSAMLDAGHEHTRKPCCHHTTATEVSVWPTLHRVPSQHQNNVCVACPGSLLPCLPAAASSSGDHAKRFRLPVNWAHVPRREKATDNKSSVLEKLVIPVEEKPRRHHSTPLVWNTDGLKSMRSHNTHRSQTTCLTDAIDSTYLSAMERCRSLKPWLVTRDHVPTKRTASYNHDVTNNNTMRGERLDTANVNSWKFNWPNTSSSSKARSNDALLTDTKHGSAKPVSVETRMVGNDSMRSALLNKLSDGRLLRARKAGSKYDLNNKLPRDVPTRTDNASGIISSHNADSKDHDLATTSDHMISTGQWLPGPPRYSRPVSLRNVVEEYSRHTVSSVGSHAREDLLNPRNINVNNNSEVREIEEHFAKFVRGIHTSETVFCSKELQQEMYRNKECGISNGSLVFLKAKVASIRDECFHYRKSVFDNIARQMNVTYQHHACNTDIISCVKIMSPSDVVVESLSKEHLSSTSREDIDKFADTSCVEMLNGTTFDDLCYLTRSYSEHHMQSFAREIVHAIYCIIYKKLTTLVSNKSSGELFSLTKKESFKPDVDLVYLDIQNELLPLLTAGISKIIQREVEAMAQIELELPKIILGGQYIEKTVDDAHRYCRFELTSQMEALQNGNEIQKCTIGSNVTCTKNDSKKDRRTRRKQYCENIATIDVKQSNDNASGHTNDTSCSLPKSPHTTRGTNNNNNNSAIDYCTASITQNTNASIFSNDSNISRHIEIDYHNNDHSNDTRHSLNHLSSKCNSNNAIVNDDSGNTDVGDNRTNTNMNYNATSTNMNVKKPIDEATLQQDDDIIPSHPYAHSHDSLNVPEALENIIDSVIERVHHGIQVRPNYGAPLISYAQQQQSLPQTKHMLLDLVGESYICLQVLREACAVLQGNASKMSIKRDETTPGGLAANFARYISVLRQVTNDRRESALQYAYERVAKNLLHLLHFKDATARRNTLEVPPSGRPMIKVSPPKEEKQDSEKKPPIIVTKTEAADSGERDELKKTRRKKSVHMAAPEVHDRFITTSLRAHRDTDYLHDDHSMWFPPYGPYFLATFMFVIVHALFGIVIALGRNLTDTASTKWLIGVLLAMFADVSFFQLAKVFYICVFCIKRFGEVV